MISFFQLFMPGKDYQKYSRDIITFENDMRQEYPYGLNDSFKISHGNNYFRFFERFGKLFYQTYYNNNILIATCAAVLRSNNIWYIGDLKVHKKWRKKNIPLKMLNKSFFIGMLITQKAYSIEMIGSNNKNESRILKLLYNYKIKKNLTIKKLSIYNLSYIEICKVIDYIRAYHQKIIVFLNLKNVKDLILSSTGKPLNVLHVASIDSVSENDLFYSLPQPNHTHMFSCFYGDLLYLILLKMRFKNNAKAWIIAHNIDIDKELSFLSTAEI